MLDALSHQTGKIGLQCTNLIDFILFISLQTLLKLRNQAMLKKQIENEEMLEKAKLFSNIGVQYILIGQFAKCTNFKQIIYTLKKLGLYKYIF